MRSKSNGRVIFILAAVLFGLVFSGCESSREKERFSAFQSAITQVVGFQQQYNHYPTPSEFNNWLIEGKVKGFRSEVYQFFIYCDYNGKPQLEALSDERFYDGPFLAFFDWLFSGGSRRHYYWDPTQFMVEYQ
jgi:hypothetical protein